MRRFSLSQRLTLLFILLLTLCATIACAVQLYSTTQYGNAMVQRLSGGLAQQIVQREPILDAQGRVDRHALKPLFDRLMTFNQASNCTLSRLMANCWLTPRRRGISSGKKSISGRCRLSSVMPRGRCWAMTREARTKRFSAQRRCVRTEN